jgi:Mrp family chromosome partitioning ATPase
MSRNSLVLERASSHGAFPVHATPAARQTIQESGEYLDLIQQVFHRPAAVAIVASGAGMGSFGICDGIAAELAASGRRVVVVSADAVLRMKPVTVPDETACVPGNVPNVWVWPARAGLQIPFFRSGGEPAGDGDWIDALRRHFDSILLDCTATPITPSVTQIAARADAVVLVAEAGRTPRPQIHRAQRALEISGAQLAGCILIRRR